MKVYLQFRLEDRTTLRSEILSLGTIIKHIPYLAKEYRPLTQDYRGYREGDKLRVTFLDAEKKEIKSEVWEQWGSFKFDDFRPLPQRLGSRFVCYAKVEKTGE